MHARAATHESRPQLRGFFFNKHKPDVEERNSRQEKKKFRNFRLNLGASPVCGAFAMPEEALESISEKWPKIPDPHDITHKINPFVSPCYFPTCVKKG